MPGDLEEYGQGPATGARLKKIRIAMTILWLFPSVAGVFGILDWLSVAMLYQALIIGTVGQKLLHYFLNRAR